MAKQFLANRSGQTPTLDEVPNETIKIYPTEAALDADLANLEENEIVATEEDNNPASGTQYPVDVVQNGNMNAVTSNAVAGYIKPWTERYNEVNPQITSWTKIGNLNEDTEFLFSNGSGWNYVRPIAILPSIHLLNVAIGSVMYLNKEYYLDSGTGVQIRRLENGDVEIYHPSDIISGRFIVYGR